MYPAEFVKPMRDELTAIGFKQLSEVAQVDEAISAEGTTLVPPSRNDCGKPETSLRRVLLSNIKGYPFFEGEKTDQNV
jgi:putative YphP/YqiW family bacilliredoxin